MTPRLLLLALPLLLAGPAFGATAKASDTTVVFHISHPAKEFDGRLSSGGADAELTYDPADASKLRLKASIRVGSFDSKNTKRDSHMMEVLEGLIFPTIEWQVKEVSGISGPWAPGTYEITAAGPLKLHGLVDDLVVPVTLTVAEDGTITAKSSFSVSLDNYQIHRPTLIFVPIEDIVPIQVTMTIPAGPGLFPPAAQEAAPETNEAGTAPEEEPGE